MINKNSSLLSIDFPNTNYNMAKKSKNILYPDWRKIGLFFIVVSLFFSLWLYVLFNSLPIMVIGTNEFQTTFCNIQLTASNCSLTNAKIYQKETQLSQQVNALNQKYNIFAKLNPTFDLAKTFFPSGAMSCILDRDVTSLMNQNPLMQNTNILGVSPTCDSNSVLILFLNLLIIYILICCAVWLYDNKR